MRPDQHHAAFVRVAHALNHVQVIRVDEDRLALVAFDLPVYPSVLAAHIRERVLRYFVQGGRAILSELLEGVILLRSHLNHAA